MWFWHQNWAIWQFYTLIDLDRVLACTLFRLICGCEDWLVTDAKKTTTTDRPFNRCISLSGEENVTEGGRPELVSDTCYPLSLLYAMWNYKPVKVRTSFNSTSKDKWWGEGIPQQGSISPVLPHFPLKKIPKGRWVKRSDHCPLFTAPPFNPLWNWTSVGFLNTLKQK